MDLRFAAVIGGIWFLLAMMCSSFVESLLVGVGAAAFAAWFSSYAKRTHGIGQEESSRPDDKKRESATREM